MTNRQPSWNRYEAAILLDAFIATKDGTLNRKDAIRNVSISLKQMAANQKKAVNDLFRDENGILFQMYSMESAYYGRTIFKPATKLFTDVVRLYHEFPDEYQELLKEAKVMIEGQKTVEDDFLSYLEKKVSSSQLKILYPCYSEIEKFCTKLKILQKPLFQTTDFEIIKKVQWTIEHNKIFKIMHKKQYSKILFAFGYYYDYVKEGRFMQITLQNNFAETTIMSEDPSTVYSKRQNTDKNTMPKLSKTEQDGRLLKKYPIIYDNIYDALKELSEKFSDGVSVTQVSEKIDHIVRPAVIEEILDNVSWSSCIGDNYIFSDQIVDKRDIIEAVNCNTVEEMYNATVYTVNFYDTVDLTHSKPQSLIYYGEKKQFGNSWAELYITLIAILCNKYPHIFVPGMSFSKNGTQVDLAENTNYSFMFVPKQIPGTNLILETNRSTNRIVAKIKYILKLCDVDFKNVIITYKKKDRVSSLPYSKHQANPIQQMDSGEINSDAFFQYLRNTQKMALSTCRGYVSAIRICEVFAKKQRFKSSDIYSCDKDTAKQTIKLLLSNADFQKYNTRQHNRFLAALKKYIMFLDEEPFHDEEPLRHREKHSVQQVKLNDSYRDKRLESVLKKYFTKGFLMGSPLEIRRLRKYYAVMHEAELTESDEKISNMVRALCIICKERDKERAFLPEVMLSEELKNKLFEYIDRSFADGKSAIYYQAIYTEFSDAFLDYHIHDVEMLKAYLTFMGNGRFYINRSFISKEPNVVIDPLTEIRSCLIEYDRPVTYDELFEALSHLPQKKIKQILASNAEFINNGEGIYFHEKILRLSEEELEGIAEIINQAIEKNGFISGNELYDAIKAKYSYIIEEYQNLSVYGFRDALKAKLNDRFSFNGNIISDYGNNLSMTDVFAKYAESRDSFTLSELKELASSLATVIYFDAVYENSLRISEEQFVSKEKAQFVVHDIDDTLDLICTGKYMPICEVKNFGIFPYAGFPWNSFLLEHYVAIYSQKYKLLHTNFNGSECVGAIVKRSANIESFDDLIVDLLVNNQLEMKKAPVLDFLRDNGYIARKQYSEIETLIIRAKALKLRKEEI